MHNRFNIASAGADEHLAGCFDHPIFRGKNFSIEHDIHPDAPGLRQRVRTDCPDLVILGPELDGDTIGAFLAEVTTGNEPIVPIVVLRDTSHASDLAADFISLGAFECLHLSDIDRELLIRHLALIVERQFFYQRLNTSELEWTRAMDHMSDPLYILDTNRCLVRANKAFYEAINNRPETSEGRLISDLVHPEGEEEPCTVCQAEIAMADANITMEADDINNPSGNPLEIAVRVLRHDSGKAAGLLMSMHDLSHSRALEERLSLLASAFDNSAQGVFVTDASRAIVEANQACSDLLGYSRDELMGATPTLFSSGQHDNAFYEDLWRTLLEEGQWRGEIWNRRKNGETFPVWQSISSITDRDGNITHFTSIFSDLSQIKRSQEELNRLALYDPLTELLNRSSIVTEISRGIGKARAAQSLLAVIFLDIDHFKHINDSFGHPIGDEFLKQLAERFSRFADSHILIGRTGGDEFVFIIKGCITQHQIIQVADRLLQALNEPFSIGDRNIRVGGSIGISIYPRHGQDASTLMRNADAAMFKAKERGRGCWHMYERALTETAMERVVMENQLRGALERGELSLAFQPQINLGSHQVIGVETLLRWQNPDLGQVSPGDFIPLAEDTGLILQIGDWVLRQACHQAVKWRQQGIPIDQVAVNVSGLQIQRGDFLKTVQAALEDSGLPAECLELEVTEGFIMVHAESAISQLEALRALGVMLTIDDFGTGYSSLSYLKRLPLHRLKIDKSFIQDIPGNVDGATIVETIIAMSKALRLEVMAEGVEKEAQSKFLIAKGCTQMQGFLYARPMGIKDLNESDHFRQHK